MAISEASRSLHQRVLRLLRRHGGWLHRLCGHHGLCLHRHAHAKVLGLHRGALRLAWHRLAGHGRSRLAGHGLAGHGRGHRLRLRTWHACTLGEHVLHGLGLGL
jgi:hypothetical protein